MAPKRTGRIGTRQQRRRQQRRADPEAPAHPVSSDIARWIRLLSPLLIIVIGALAFASSFDGKFLFDDIANITERQWLRGDDAVDRILKRSDRPLTDLTFALNMRLARAEPGQPLDPVGFHAVNLLIHLTAGLLLYGVVRRTLLLPVFRGRFDSSAVWIALIIACIWTVHPLQTQSVTYIVQRAESMMGMFYLLTLYCYIRGATAGASLRWSWFAGSVVACAAGMATKSVMVTAPVLIVLYDYCLLSRSWKQSFIKRGPALLGLYATWSVLLLTGIATDVLDPTRSPEHTVVGLGYRAKEAGELTWFYYFLTQPEVLLHYLRLSIWPSPLVLDYRWPLAQSVSEALLPVAVIVLAGVATLWALIRRPALGFVAASFFVVLAPTSSIIPIADVAFEHRMYVPLAAVVSLVVIGAALLLQHVWSRTSASPALRAAIATSLAGAVVLALAGATYARNLDYHDPEHMWRDVIAKAGRHPRALNNLATWLIKQSEQETDPQRKAALDDESCTIYQEIVDYGVERADLPMDIIYYNLANCFKRRGELDTAVDYYELSLEHNPRYLRSHIMYGNTLSQLGRHAAAAEKFRAATDVGGPARSPERSLLVARAHYNLGNELYRLGRLDEAVASYARAARTSPDYAKAWFNAGQGYELLRQPHKAIEAYETLLRLMPDHQQGQARLRALQSS